MSEDKNYVIPGSRAEIMERIRILEQQVHYLEKIIADLKIESIKFENDLNQMKKVKR